MVVGRGGCESSVEGLWVEGRVSRVVGRGGYEGNLFWGPQRRGVTLAAAPPPSGSATEPWYIAWQCMGIHKNKDTLAQFRTNVNDVGPILYQSLNGCLCCQYWC